MSDVNVPMTTTSAKASAWPTGLVAVHRYFPASSTEMDLNVRYPSRDIAARGNALPTADHSMVMGPSPDAEQTMLALSPGRTICRTGSRVMRGGPVKQKWIAQSFYLINNILNILSDLLWGIKIFCW